MSDGIKTIIVKNSKGIAIGEVYEHGKGDYESYTYELDFGHDMFDTLAQTIKDVREMHREEMIDLRAKKVLAETKLLYYKEM